MAWEECTKCKGDGTVSQKQPNGMRLLVDCRPCGGKGGKYVPDKK
jgi:DnaJ-class molecular chaperone